MSSQAHPFLQSATGPAWKRLGVDRRAGVLVPLFFIQSQKSVGVGEIPDLELLGEWCRDCGMSLIQLLPLNDVGTRFCPYDSESSFALEPMHLSLDRLEGVPARKYADRISAMRAKYPSRTERFDTRVKADKLELLRAMFDDLPKKAPKGLEEFRQTERYWLPAYALYKVLKEASGQRPWQEWPEALKRREAPALREAAETHAEEILFQEWLQWQLYLQFSETAARLRAKKVHLIGDLPFLVARDSADVWSHPEYFKLHLSAGAPPDLYLADGQEWGMPPYDWKALEAGGYDYIKEKLRFASSFYDLYRLDHFVGLFRVWAFPLNGGPDRKKQAAFDPPEEEKWEPQARTILRAMLDSGSMLPCAEDLGTVPDVARKVLEEYAIPGMDVQRWMRDWEGSGDYTPPAKYRPHSIVTLSTHDMSSFLGWWRLEATPDDKERFLRFAGLTADADNAALCRAALERAHEAASIFSVHSMQDLLVHAGVLNEWKAELRINRPGTVDENNWRLRVPAPLEELLKLPANKNLLQMHKKHARI
jgi:4-alpha-glucanotransferase